MGSILSKWKNEKKMKKRAGKNTPRNAGSTQSLNMSRQGSVSASPNPGVYAQPAVKQSPSRRQSVEDSRIVEPESKTQRTQTIADHNVYAQPAVTQTLSGKKSVETSIVMERRCKIPQTQTVPDPVQKENNKSVPGGQRTSEQRPITGGADKPTERIYNSPNLRSKPKVKATMDYEANNGDDLSFKKGDITELINDGYFMQLNRKGAEEKLQEPEVEIGTYLLRPSEEPGGYALSLRCENEFCELDITHYKIKVHDKGVCYIDADSNIKPFSNIMELIKYYTETPGLRCKLQTPLPRDNPLDDLAVMSSDFQIGEKLGSGNFAIVYAGTLHGNKDVAVKSLRAGGSMTIKEFRQEAETMHKLRHPNLVSLLAICEGNDKIYIFTERMSKGALLTLLQKDTDHTITFTDLMDMAIQVVEGMCYLERKGFVHRDLRAANVLVGDGNITKIADFGLTRLLDTYYEHEDYYTSKKGEVFPHKWTAPEAIKLLKFTVKSDVWSFGILLYEMVTRGDEPYAAMSNTEALEWVEKGNRLKKPADQQCPMTLYNIMNDCWLMNSKERPNFERIKETLLEIKTNA